MRDKYLYFYRYVDCEQQKGKITYRYVDCEIRVLRYYVLIIFHHSLVNISLTSTVLTVVGGFSIVVKNNTQYYNSNFLYLVPSSIDR